MGYLPAQGAQDLLVLQLMHYQGALSTGGPAPRGKTLQPYERHLLRVVEEQGLCERVDIFERMAEHGWVKSDVGRKWTLTESGYLLGYNLCEYYIQQRSGFWASLSEYFAGVCDGCVVDVGCGGGLGYSLARESGLFVGMHKIGVDVSAATLDAGRKAEELLGLDEHVERVCADALILPLSDASISVFISRSALQYLDRSAFLEELIRVLRPGGKFVVSVPSWKTMAAKLRCALGGLRFRESLRFGAAVANSVAIMSLRRDLVVAGGRNLRGETMTTLSRLFRHPEIVVKRMYYHRMHPAAHPIIILGEKAG